MFLLCEPHHEKNLLFAYMYVKTKGPQRIDSTIPLLLNPKFEASSRLLCLCRPWLETPEDRFAHDAARVVSVIYQR